MSKLEKKKELLASQVRRRNEINAKIKNLESEIERLESQELQFSLKELNINASQAVALLKRMKEKERQEMTGRANDGGTAGEMRNMSLEAAGGVSA